MNLDVPVSCVPTFSLSWIWEHLRTNVLLPREGESNTNSGSQERQVSPSHVSPPHPTWLSSAHERKLGRPDATPVETGPPLTSLPLPLFSTPPEKLCSISVTSDPSPGSPCDLRAEGTALKQF